MADKKLSPEAQSQLADLALQLAHDPKTSKQYKKLVKELHPDRHFPDVEVDDLREEVKTLLAARDQKEESDRVNQGLRAQRNGLITSGKFTEEDVKKMETDVMEKHGISDYEVAAKVYAADTRPANPTPEIKSRVWEMPKLAKEDIDNINQHTLKNAYAVVDEITAQRNRH